MAEIDFKITNTRAHAFPHMKECRPNSALFRGILAAFVTQISEF